MKPAPNTKTDVLADIKILKRIIRSIEKEVKRSGEMSTRAIVLRCQAHDLTTFSDTLAGRFEEISQPVRWRLGWNDWVNFLGEAEGDEVRLEGYLRAAEANERCETGNRPTKADADEFNPYL